MNPKVKMRAELEEKYRLKYEEKAKQLEAEFKQLLEVERANNRRKLLLGMQMADDAALMATDDTFDVNEYSAEKFHDRYVYYVNEMSRMAVVEDKDDPDMEWTKSTIDRRLLQIVCKDNFVPWDERMEVEDRNQVALTNGDRIRSMTKKDLAQFLVTILDLDSSIPYCQNKPECERLLDEGEITRDMCMACMIQWIGKEPDHA